MTSKEALKQIYNGMSNNIGFVKEFKNIEQALTELEELKQEVIARQETENSLTQWVADLTTELTSLSAIKQVVDNWDEGEYYTDSIRSMKKIEDIIKGETK